jgi:hypothetical protein
MISSGAVETNVSYDDPLKTFVVEELKRTESSIDGFSPLNYGDISEKTSHEVKDEGRISFRLISNDNIPSEPVNEPALKQEVDAVIIAVDDVSVVCEVLLESGNIEIQLPKALIPNKPFYGMPVSISLDESSGYTAPVIRKRVVADESPNFSKEELTALVDSL